MDTHPALCCLQQLCMQGQTHLVFKQDKGLQQHFFARLGNGSIDAGEEVFAVFQQLEVVAIGPAGSSSAFHNTTSAASGAWSDSCRQGIRGSARGLWTAALRT